MLRRIAHLLHGLYFKTTPTRPKLFSTLIIFYPTYARRLCARRRIYYVPPVQDVSLSLESDQVSALLRRVLLSLLLDSIWVTKQDPRLCAAVGRFLILSLPPSLPFLPSSTHLSIDIDLYRTCNFKSPMTCERVP